LCRARVTIRQGKMINKKTMHKDALEAFGLSGRLKKLRTEATELAHAIDRMDEGKGGFADVLHEYRDCVFVWRSIMESNAYIDATRTLYDVDHADESHGKLIAAISAQNNAKQDCIKMKQKILKCIADADLRSAIEMLEEWHATNSDNYLVQAHLVLIDALEFGRGPEVAARAAAIIRKVV